MAQAAWVSAELPSPRTSAPRISVQLLQTQYATDASLETQSNTYQYVMPRLYAKAPLANIFQWKVDFNGVLPVSEAGESHYFFPDLYAGLDDQKRGLALYFGRKRQTWSELDNDLHLGLWEPLFRWDHARPVAMGLTGFHFESRQRIFQIKAMLSPFYLPDQQPDFEIVDGEIVSGNRWFRRPIHSLEIGNSPSEVRYKVNEPEVKDVVMNESYALMGRIGKKTGPFFRASWAKKPMNQFHLGIDLEDSFRVDLDTFEAEVNPIIVNHELLTVEAGYNTEAVRGYISFTQERFEDPNLPTRWEETDLNDSNYLGLGLKHRAPNPFVRNSALTWSYAKREKKNEDRNTRIDGELDASTSRFPFESWLSLKWDFKKAFKLFRKSRQWQNSITYSYSAKDDGDWIALNSTVNMTRDFQIYVSADMFGAGKNVSQDDRSFISIYRNNDRVQGGFVYAF